MAKWHRVCDIPKEIILEDNKLISDFPYPHNCFLTYGYSIKIPTGYKLNLILSLSDSISYERDNEVLYVRSDSHSSNVGIIFTVIDILESKYSDDIISSINWSKYYAQNLLYAIYGKGYGLAFSQDHAECHLKKMENRVQIHRIL
jgi:hypothetical protein